MGLFSKILQQIIDYSKPSPTKNKSRTPYISPDRDMEQFREQVKYFPTMEVDKRLLEPLEQNLLPGDIILLNWLNMKPVTAIPPVYFEYTYGINAAEDREMLKNMGFLQYAAPSDSLKALLVPELKSILRSNSLKVSGKKAELIERIRINADESSYKNLIKPTFVVTKSGQALLDKYSNLVWAHRNNSKDGNINVAEALSKTADEMQASLDYSRSIAGMTEQNLAEVENFDYYEIMCTLDAKTCPTCAKMDGKIYKSREAKPGVNLPPFHENCRCTTAPYMPDLPPATERWYRDPKTGKGEIGPYKTYSEWHEAMIKKYGNNIFK